MKRLFILLGLLLALFMLSTTPTRAANNIALTIDCKLVGYGGTQVFVGYTAADEFQGISAWTVFNGQLIGEPPASFEGGEHRRAFGFDLASDGSASWTAIGDTFSYTIEIYPDSDAPDCSDFGTGQSDGGLATISKDVNQDGNYLWEIQDTYGHWSEVAVVHSQDEDGRLFVRLVLGPDNSVTDANRYRVTLTP